MPLSLDVYALILEAPDKVKNDERAVAAPVDELLVIYDGCDLETAGLQLLLGIREE